MQICLNRKPVQTAMMSVVSAYPKYAVPFSTQTRGHGTMDNILNAVRNGFILLQLVSSTKQILSPVTATNLPNEISSVMIIPTTGVPS